MPASAGPPGPQPPDAPADCRNSRAGRLSTSLTLAVSFLTVVPVRLRGPLPALGVAAVWFPVVGALLGGLAGGLDYVAQPSLGPDLAAILAIGLLVAITGGLHADGLADCADGLGARGDRARRLAIMRDSSIGTFGALALILWLMLFVAATAGLDRGGAPRAIVVAAGLGRWAALVHAGTASPARPDGLGAGFTVGRRAFLFATVVAAALAGTLLGLVHAVVAIVVAAALGLVVSAWARRGIGGRTGDTLGACVALTEVAVLVALLGVGVR